jgi:cholesterol transport system auxiliary component
MKPVLVLAALSLMLTGCVNLGEKSNTPAMVYYVLNDSMPTAEPSPLRAGALKDSDPLRAEARVESSAPTLLVLDTATGGFYDTDQLIFCRSAATRGQYQYARWTERPGKRFADLMRTRLDRQGAWNVTAAGGYARADVLLDTKLVEFYHDATSEPGQVRLVLRAELVDLKQRTLLGRRVFEQQVALTTYDAAGAAKASSLAVSRVLDELTFWLATLQLAPTINQ